MAAVLVVVLLFAHGAPADADCVDWTLWGFEAYPWFVTADQPDSVRTLLRDWREVCGSTEPIVRSEILAAIWLDEFDEARLPERLLPLLVDYQLDRSWLDELGEGDGGPWGRFALFTEDMAAQLVPVTTPGSTADLLARFYSGDFEGTWARLRTPAYEGTPLQAAFARERRRLRTPEPRRVLALHVGGWDGTGDLHGGRRRALVGGQFGADSGWGGLRLVGELRVGSLGRNYLVRDDAALVPTDDFSGLTLLLEPHLRVWRFRWGQLGMAAGAGWSGAQALPAEPENDLPARWIRAFPVELGADLRLWRGRTGRFVELQARREWADWNTGVGGSDLDGGSWILRLVVGSVRDVDRERREALGVADPY